MTLFARALYAETLKLKRTLALLLVVVAPLSVVFVNFMSYVQNRGFIPNQNDDLWLRFTTSTLVVWTLLMLPLYVSLETALLNGLEHGQHNWKLLYAQPVRRWNIYASKQLVALALIAASTVVLCGFIVLFGLLAHALRPELPFGAIPWGTLFTAAGLTFLAAWLIISLHLWISARWPSFVVALGAGIVAVTANVMLINSDYAYWYPWALAGLAGLNYVDGKAVLDQLMLGMGGGVLVSLVGAWDIARRDVV